MTEESEVSNTVEDPPTAISGTHSTRPRTSVRLREDQARINVLESQIGEVTSAFASPHKQHRELSLAFEAGWDKRVPCNRSSLGFLEGSSSERA